MKGRTYLIINIITQSLEIMLDGNNTLASELLDLRSAVVLPVRDISVVPYPQWSSGEDNRADIVIMASRSHGFLVGLGSTSLISQDETGTNPNGAGAEHKSSGDSLAVVDTASSNNLYGLSSHWALLALDELHNCRDQDSGGDIASVSTSLSSLCADDIDTEIEALLNVFGVSNHVHV